MYLVLAACEASALEEIFATEKSLPLDYVPYQAKPSVD